jgi:hypothetical protein
MPEKTTETTGQQLPSDTKNYIMLELHCDMTQCKPCTYPVCPLLKKKEEKGISSKTVELATGPLHERVDGKMVMTEDIRRYVMVEISCDRTKCDPCTYPNCQRFTREIAITHNHVKDKKKPKVRRVLLLDRNGKVITPKE